MDAFFSQLSSYNLLNYLLPGVIFSFIAHKFWAVGWLKDANDLEKIFIWYFLGLFISRIGSLHIEPYLRKKGYLNFADYKDFIKASKADKSLRELSEINNTFRTMLALFLVTFVISLVKFLGLVDVEMPIKCIFNILIDRGEPLCFSPIMIYIFYASYRKQTKYIYDRINADLNNDNRWRKILSIILNK